MRQKSAGAFATGVGNGRIAIAPSVAGTLLVVMSFAAPQSGFSDSAVNPQSQNGSVAASFTVAPRTDQLFYFPCADCHEFMDANTTIRALEVEEGHPETLQHGEGQIWCFTCHDPSNYGRLLNLLSKPIDLDQGYQVCSSCHSQKYLEWTHGAHGKRKDNWLGERQLYSCVQCHNPHQPAIAPRPPRPPPPIRAGLEPMATDVLETSGGRHRPIWELLHDQ